MDDLEAVLRAKALISVITSHCQSLLPLAHPVQSLHASCILLQIPSSPLGTSDELTQTTSFRAGEKYSLFPSPAAEQPPQPQGCPNVPLHICSSGSCQGDLDHQEHQQGWGMGDLLLQQSAAEVDRSK